MFAFDKGLRALSSAMAWYMDGNFAMAPKQFKQVFVERAILGRVPVSAAYALLPSKRSSAYREMLRALRTECFDQQLVPVVQNVVTDFEKEILKAVNAIFGKHISLRGCFFHFQQVRHNLLLPQLLRHYGGCIPKLTFAVA